ncbi:hypothetical protein WME81_13120 [Sorangium sp. So ce1078]
MQIEKILQTIADSSRVSLRSPILHSPAEHASTCEHLTFPSQDGVPLEGWFIRRPAPTRSSSRTTRAGSAAPGFRHI